MAAAASKRQTTRRALRTVIVDDSALARLMLREALVGIDGVQVVGNASEGIAALDVIDSVQPDLVILDVEMPGMDGLAMLREMNFRGLETPVLMCSRLTSVGAEVTTEALLQGAYDFVCKPDGPDRKANLRRLRRDIQHRIKPLVHPTECIDEEVGLGSVTPPRSLADATVDAVFIGASTGGPVALHELLSQLDPRIKVPILVVQHIPAGFSEPLARRLGHGSRLPVVEASDNTAVSPGVVYIAPGGHHTVIKRCKQTTRIKLCDDPPVNGCRPSIDVMLHSAAECFEDRSLVVMLTGMGRDGAAGAHNIRSRGGVVFVQHPASCTVSSMPRQTIATAGADRIADLVQLSDLINGLGVKS